MELKIESQANHPTIVRLSGTLDMLSASAVKQGLARAVAEGHRRLVVDLAEVSFIDSTGLGALIGGLKAARLAGGDLRLARAADQARVILQLTTLDRVLRPYATLEEAVAEY